MKSRGDLSGRIAVDGTNPLGMGSNGLELVLGHDMSGGERVASWAPGAAVFKTFNQTGAENTDKAARFPVRPVVMFVARRRSCKKAGGVRPGFEGFEAIDAGPFVSPACSNLLPCCGSTRL